MTAYGLIRRQREDVTSGGVKGRDNTSRVSGDNTVGNGAKDVIHILFIFPDLLHDLVQVGEETGVLDGGGRLIAEGQQQVAVPSFKCSSGKAAIDIDCPNTFSPHN